MNRKVPVIALVLLAAIAAAGKSSKLMMSWKNPVTPERKFHRVLALGLGNTTEIRADFEDALAAQLASAGFETVPGHAILLRPAGTQLDLNTLKQQMKTNQIEAVVVSRLVKVENTVTYIPGAPIPYPYYRTFYGYYGTLYPVVFSPDYLKKERKVRVETNLYFVTAESEGQLVWTGITDTFNPSDVHKAIKGLVKLVVTQMQKEEAL